jgi:hypothetical protein
MESFWRRDYIDRACVAVLSIVRLYTWAHHPRPTDLATAPRMKQARRASALRRWQQAFAQFAAMEISEQSTLLATFQQKPRRRAA